MLIDKDLRLSISGCFWLFYASKYNLYKKAKRLLEVLIESFFIQRII